MLGSRVIANCIVFQTRHQPPIMANSGADSAPGLRIKHVSLAIGILDTCAVMLRLLARWRSKAAYAADDAFIAVSLLPLYGMIVLGFIGTQPLSIPLNPVVC